MDAINQDVVIAILGAALALSEALSFIPSVRANGIFQAIANILRRIVVRS